MTDIRDGERVTLASHDPLRARHLAMLEFGSRQDFDDPSLADRRLFSELLGTFMLVLVAAGGGILHAKGQISLSAVVVAPGVMVMAIILFMGAVSGAHLNPVVSIAFALRGDFSWTRVPGYIAVQLLGATLACLFLLVVFGDGRRANFSRSCWVGHTRAGERDGGASGDSAGNRGSTFAASQRGGEPEQRQRPSVEVSIGSSNRSSGSSSKRRSRRHEGSSLIGC